MHHLRTFAVLFLSVKWDTLSAGQWLSIWGPSRFPPCLSNCRFPRYFIQLLHHPWRLYIWICRNKLFPYLHVGRRRELLIAALLYVLGAVLTAFAPGLSVLLVGRLLYGLGIGLVSFAKPIADISSRFIMTCLFVTACLDAIWQAMHGAPLYIAETCPSQIRGTLISLKELFIVLGILVRFLRCSITTHIISL